MYELAVVCAHTDARKGVQSPGDLPAGWVSVPELQVGGVESVKRDLHFASWDALARWAASQQVKQAAMPRVSLTAS